MFESSCRVVLLVCCCLLLSRSIESFSAMRHILRTHNILRAKDDGPSEAGFGYTFAERTVNNVTAHTGGNSTGKPKRTVVSKNPRDWTPYNFKDADGEYDVPFINEAMWYRLSVRRNSEKKLAEALKLLRDSDETWGTMFEEVYYPQQPVVRIKDKSLFIAFKAMAPGLVYIKTKMNPDLADDIESIKGVYAFLKNPNNLIVPLSPSEGESIEVMRDRETAVIDPELMLMKKDEYVSVVSGPRKGRYGILMGAKNGKLEVCLRSEYKDDWDTFEFDQLRYLADPPEKKWMLLTPKEALESLMAKDPYNPTVKAFKKNGLLEEILYPDGRPEDQYSNNRGDRGDWGDKKTREPRESRYDSNRDTQGREGGRSMRSIASEKPTPNRAASGTSSSSAGDTDDWGASSSAKSTSPITPSASSAPSSFSDSFNIAAWGDSLSSSSSRKDRGLDDKKKTIVPQNSRNTEAQEADEGGSEDFDSFIQGLLSDMDEPAASASNANTPAAASASVSNSNSKVIVSGGKREWVPSKERLQQQAQQQQQQQPSKPERRSEDSYSSSSPKSNDWFDDRDSYDAFSNTGSSSSPSSSRSSRSTSNSKVEADRLDSERILNELLMDLDSSSRVGSSDSDSGIDYFDFSVDSDDVRSPSKARDAPSRAMTKAAPASSARTVAPKMEDFASFEQYLDALVSHEKTSTSGGGGTSWDNSKKGVSAGRDFDSRGGSAGRDVDGLDDSLLAFLGGDDEDNVTRGSRSPQNSQNTRKISTGNERANEAPKVRSWNPQPSKPDSRVEATESIDDLDSFLDSLEASNVLPSKMKVANLVEKKIEKVSVKSSPVVAESIVESASPHTDYAVYTVKDLKDKLRERGLPVSGSKAELVTRLNKAN